MPKPFESAPLQGGIDLSRSTVDGAITRPKVILLSGLGPRLARTGVYSHVRAYLGNHATLVVIAFSMVYACSLSFVYVEGDDASSIVFHALGRRSSLQPPYGPYQGMMDLILRVLPAREPDLRVAAILISSLATVGFVLLALSLVFEWLETESERRKTVAAVVILLSCPELFYFGLVYEPIMVAMCFVLAAHRVLLGVRRCTKLLATNRWKAKAAVALSVFLFGVGTACRWDVGIYGLVIVTDLIAGAAHERGSSKCLKRRIAFGIFWGLLAIMASLAAIGATGYGVREFVGVLSLARKEVSSPSPWFFRVGAFQTLITPALLFIGTAGFIALIRWQSRLALIVTAGILPVLPFVFSREPKMILPALPGMFLCLVKGSNVVWPAKVPMRRDLILKVGVGALLIAPWLVGVRILSADTSWGPGFEIRSPTCVTNVNSGGCLKWDSDPRRTAGVKGFWLTTGSGFAVPTPEGPRPLGGHAAVLLGGAWRALVNELDYERERAIRQAMALRVPVVQDEANSYILAHLLQMGFTTQDPRNQLPQDGFVERRFFNGIGDRQVILLLKIRASLFDGEQLDRISRASGGGRVVLYSGYSSTIKRLVAAAPGAIQVQGPFSAVLDVDGLSRAVKEKPRGVMSGIGPP